MRITLARFSTVREMCFRGKKGNPFSDIMTDPKAVSKRTNESLINYCFIGVGVVSFEE